MTSGQSWRLLLWPLGPCGGLPKYLVTNWFIMMFDSLAGRLGEVFAQLTKRGALTEADVGKAMREVRVALLEADVALPVSKLLLMR